MPIYFAQQGDTGPVKIGLSVKPGQRLAFLKTSSPEPIHLRRLFEGGPAEEAALHARFAAHRLSGEWFRPVPEILAGAIGLPEIPITRTHQSRAAAEAKPKGEAKPCPQQIAYWSPERRAKYRAGVAARWSDPEWVARTKPGREYAGACISGRAAFQYAENALADLRRVQAEGSDTHYEAERLRNVLAKLEDIHARVPHLLTKARANIAAGGAIGKELDLIRSLNSLVMSLGEDFVRAPAQQAEA